MITLFTKIRKFTLSTNPVKLLKILQNITLLGINTEPNTLDEVNNKPYYFYTVTLSLSLSLSLFWLKNLNNAQFPPLFLSLAESSRTLSALLDLFLLSRISLCSLALYYHSFGLLSLTSWSVKVVVGHRWPKQVGVGAQIGNTTTRPRQQHVVEVPRSSNALLRCLIQSSKIHMVSISLENPRFKNGYENFMDLGFFIFMFCLYFSNWSIIFLFHKSTKLTQYFLCFTAMDLEWFKYWASTITLYICSNIMILGILLIWSLLTDLLAGWMCDFGIGFFVYAFVYHSWRDHIFGLAMIHVVM